MNLFEKAREREMIDRAKLMQLAMEKEPDPQKALILYDEMVRRIEGTRPVEPAPPAPPAPTPPPAPAAATPTGRRITPRTEDRAKVRLHWNDQERAEAIRLLLVENRDYEQIGRALGRTAGACATELSRLRKLGLLKLPEAEIA